MEAYSSKVLNFGDKSPMLLDEMIEKYQPKKLPLLWDQMSIDDQKRLLDRFEFLDYCEISRLAREKGRDSEECLKAFEEFGELLDLFRREGKFSLED